MTDAGFGETERGLTRTLASFVRVAQRSIAMLGVGLVVVLIASACTDTSEGLGVFSVPEIGETEPGLLEDGHPVFVVHDLDGSVYVVEAVSTHIVDDHMAWCPSSRTINDVFHGALWDAQGRYVSGPGASDLGSYRIDLSNGESELTVVAYVEPLPRSESSDGTSGPACVADRYQIHPFYETD